MGFGGSVSGFEFTVWVFVGLGVGVLGEAAQSTATSPPQDDGRVFGNP